MRQPGTDHAVLTELQTRGPDCRRGFLESPEEWPALFWGDRVANGAAASFTLARLQRATWCLLGPGRAVSYPGCWSPDFQTLVEC